jgi:hypothetical protein
MPLAFESCKEIDDTLTSNMNLEFPIRTPTSVLFFSGAAFSMALAPEYPILHNFGWGAFWFFLGLGPFPWVISRIDDLVSDDDSTEVLYWVSKIGEIVLIGLGTWSTLQAMLTPLTLATGVDS